MRARVVGKGLQEKRARLLRSIDAHVRWLRVAATLGPWTPPVREPHAERPRLMGRYRGLPEYVYPREKPELARPCPGPEALSEAQIAAYVGTHPELNPAAAPATVRALAFIETFRRRT